MQGVLQKKQKEKRAEKKSSMCGKTTKDAVRGEYKDLLVIT